MTAFTERALDGLLEHGIVAEPLLTDDAWCYTKNKGLRELPSRRASEHKAHPALQPEDQTARPSATNRRWTASGEAASPTTTQPTVRRCHTGSTTTTPAGAAANPPTRHRSAPFTTPWGTAPGPVG